MLIAFGGAPESKPAAPSTYINRDTNNRDNQNNRDYNREAPQNYSRDVDRDYAPKDRDSRDYGSRDSSNRDSSSRDSSSRNYGDREPRDTGRDTGYGGNRGRNNQDSDWDW